MIFTMTQPIQCCYSPHEQHIMDAANGDISYKKGRERIYKILDRNQNLKPVIDAERAKSPYMLKKTAYWLVVSVARVVMVFCILNWMAIFSKKQLNYCQLVLLLRSI